MKDIIYNEWLPYEGDYEKQECDIQLRNGIILKHFYPNAGDFAACCDLQGTQYESVPSKDVIAVMYREYYLESLCEKQDHRCNQIPKKENRSVGIVGAKASYVAAMTAALGVSTTATFQEDESYMITDPYAEFRGMASLYPAGGRTATHPVRTDEKISRNAPCPCGTGKKYKKCCLNQKP